MGPPRVAFPASSVHSPRPVFKYFGFHLDTKLPNGRVPSLACRQQSTAYNSNCMVNTEASHLHGVLWLVSKSRFLKKLP